MSTSTTTYRAAMMGFGNVGRAVAQLLLDRGAAVERDHGVAVRLVLVTDSTGAAFDPDGLDLRRLLDVKARTGRVSDYPGGGRGDLHGVEAIARSGADMLLEASPTSVRTGEPGLSYIRAALERGMHVVNANKGPLVVAYHELHDLARACGVELRNAATVGAPVPSLELLANALHGVRVEWIEAIPNGTTNYILTLMEGGASLEDGVEAAQQVGIAEPDASLDIDGWDSAAKIMILANAAMGGDVRLDEVAVQGIGAVTGAELAQTRREGLVLKLLATARRTGPAHRHRVHARGHGHIADAAVGAEHHDDAAPDPGTERDDGSVMGTATDPGTERDDSGSSVAGVDTGMDHGGTAATAIGAGAWHDGGTMGADVGVGTSPGRGERLELTVAPTALPSDHPLARLNRTAMGVLFHTDILGDIFISAEGDAPLGTAQAMLRDIVNIGQRQH